MEIVRYLDAGHGPLVGIRDGSGVHELPVPSLSALLALPLAGIRDVTAKAAADPTVAGEVTLLPPADGRMEVWAAGVTYFRSREARLEESGGADFYDRVYDAERPELFFKSVPWRVVTHGQAGSSGTSNSVTGAFQNSGTSTSTVTSNQTSSNQTLTGTSSTTTTTTDTTTSSGNNITGGYTTSDQTGGTADGSGEEDNQGQKVVTTSTSTSGGTSNRSGNSVTGDYTVSGTSHVGAQGNRLLIQADHRSMAS